MDSDEVRGHLHEAKAAVVATEAPLATLDGHRAPLDRERLAKRVAEWRGVLHRGPAMARSILRKLIPGKLDLFPSPEGVAFRGGAAVAGLLAGTAFVMSVVPPG